MAKRKKDVQEDTLEETLAEQEVVEEQEAPIEDFWEPKLEEQELIKSFAQKPVQEFINIGDLVEVVNFYEEEFNGRRFRVLFKSDEYTLTSTQGTIKLRPKYLRKI